MRDKKEKITISEDESAFSRPIENKKLFPKTRISLFTGKANDPNRLNAAENALNAAANQKSNLLHKRFEYFRKHFLYCTNNTHATWKTSLCIHENGKKLLMGDLMQKEEIETIVEENWRICTISIKRQNPMNN